MNEEQLHNLLTKQVSKLSDLKRTTYDPYCSYDATNEKVVVEYKCRRKYYEGSTQLEKPKFEKNLEVDDKQYLYCVYDGVDTVHIWNISWLVRDGYDFNWHIKMCPATTDFERNTMIEKTVGELRWDDSLYSFKVKIRKPEIDDKFDVTVEGLEL